MLWIKFCPMHAIVDLNVKSNIALLKYLLNFATIRGKKNKAKKKDILCMSIHLTLYQKSTITDSFENYFVIVCIHFTNIVKIIVQDEKKT